MLRLFGAILIFSGCTALGIFYRTRYYESIRLLKTMEKILDLFISEVRYGKSTLHECLFMIAEKTEEPFRGTMLSVGKLLQKEDGRDFSACWEEAFAVLLQKLPLTKEEKESFLSFAKVKGLKDWQMQVRVMEGHRDAIKEARRIREQNVLQQGKLATGLGIMGGLFLIIVLL